MEPAIPRELAAIAATAMDRDPARRYPTARELAADLARFQAGSLVHAHRYRVTERIGGWMSRNRAAAAALLSAAVAIAVIVGALTADYAEQRELRSRAEQARAVADHARAHAERVRLQLERENRRHRQVQADAFVRAIRTGSVGDPRVIDRRASAGPSDAGGREWRLPGRRIHLGDDGWLRVWRPGDSETTFKTAISAWSVIAVAPAGDRVAHWSSATSTLAVLGLDGPNTRVIDELPAPSLGVIELVFSPDARIVACVLAGGDVWMWNLADGTSGTLAAPTIASSRERDQWEDAHLTLASWLAH